MKSRIFEDADDCACKHCGGRAFVRPPYACCPQAGLDYMRANYPTPPTTEQRLSAALELLREMRPFLPYGPWLPSPEWVVRIDAILEER